MVRSNETAPNLRSLVATVYRHKCKAILCFLAVVSAAVSVTAIMQPAYRSEAKLFVRLGRENSMLDPTATIGAGPLVVVPASREEEVNSVSEILSSRVLLEAIVDEFGPDAILGKGDWGVAEAPSPKDAQEETSPAAAAATVEASPAGLASALEGLWRRIGPDPPADPRDAAVEKLGRRLKVFAARKSNVIALYYDGPSPALAQAVVTRLVDLYMEKHAHLNRPPQSQEFFSAQTEELRDRLRETEEKLRTAKDTTGVASVNEQQTILVARIGELQKGELETAADLAVSRAELASLEERMEQLPEFLERERVAGHANEAADGMKQQLFALQLKEQDLLSKFKEETFQIREIRRQIEEAKLILGQEENKRTQVTTGMNRAFEDTRLAILDRRTKITAMRARQELLEKQLADARESLRTLNQHALQITQLQRDVELQDAHFRTYSRNLEQARIDQALELQRISNISVVQPATLESGPVRPNKLLNLAMGLLAACCAAIGLALVADHFDHTVRSTQDIEERLGVPALVSIPRAARSKVHGNGTVESHDHALPR